MYEFGRETDIQSITYIQLVVTGSSLIVQCLGLHTFTTKGTSSILVGELRSHKLCGKAKKEREGEIRSGCLENCVKKNSEVLPRFCGKKSYG